MEARWHFITPHGLVLLAISHQPDATLRELARDVGLSERWVTKIVGELVEAGYVVRHRVGTSWHYGVELQRPLRHRLTRELDVRRLLLFLDAESGESAVGAAALDQEDLAAADRRLELRQLDASISQRRAELAELEGRCAVVEHALRQASEVVRVAVEGRRSS